MGLLLQTGTFQDGIYQSFAKLLLWVWDCDHIGEVRMCHLVMAAANAHHSKVDPRVKTKIH